MDKARARLTTSLVATVGFLTVCPVVMLALGSVSEGLTAFGRFTLDKYVGAYTDPAFFRVMLNTAVFVLGSSVLATVLAAFLAYLNTRTDIPFKGLFGVLSIIPMMIPHLLFSVSWALLLNPSNGIVNLVLKQAFSLESAPFDIYSLWGMILVEGLLDLPIAYLIIAPAMASFDVTLEESSRVAGAGSWRTLLRVTLPLLRPALLAGASLAFVTAFGDFVTSIMLYTYDTRPISLEILSSLRQADVGVAAAYGVVLMLVSAAVFAIGSGGQGRGGGPG